MLYTIRRDRQSKIAPVSEMVAAKRALAVVVAKAAGQKSAVSQITANSSQQRLIRFQSSLDRGEESCKARDDEVGPIADSPGLILVHKTEKSLGKGLKDAKWSDYKRSTRPVTVYGVSVGPVNKQ